MVIPAKPICFPDDFETARWRLTSAGAFGYACAPVV